MSFKKLLYFAGISLMISSMAYSQLSFTDSDLERYKKSDNQTVEQDDEDGHTNGISSNADSQPIVRRERADDRDAWCQRGERARAEIASAESKAASAQERYAARNAQFQSERTRRWFKEKEVADAKQEADEASNAADRARKSLERLEDEAHRMGVPPGWLKCNFN